MGGAFAIFGVAWEGAFDGADGRCSGWLAILKRDFANNRLDRRTEVAILILHDEFYGIAASAAAKAVEHALFGADGERRGFLLVEWAAGRPVLACFLETWQVAADDRDDIVVGSVDGGLGDFAAHLSAASVG